MRQQLEEAYQKAVALVEAYKEKGLNSLSEAEKEELEKTMKTIEEYNPEDEPLPRITSLP